MSKVSEAVERLKSMPLLDVQTLLASHKRLREALANTLTMAQLTYGRLHPSAQGEYSGFEAVRDRAYAALSDEIET